MRDRRSGGARELGGVNGPGRCARRSWRGPRFFYPRNAWISFRRRRPSWQRSLYQSGLGRGEQAAEHQAQEYLPRLLAPGPRIFGRRRRNAAVIGHSLRFRTFIRQQKVELIGRVSTPGRGPDGNRKASCCELAGQDYRIDGVGPDVGAVVIVFDRFDDECHDLWLSECGCLNVAV